MGWLLGLIAVGVLAGIVRAIGAKNADQIGMMTFVSRTQCLLLEGALKLKVRLATTSPRWET
jgi:hypothetical protein